ncbi:hypothetical protein ACVWZR_004422 [Bradyrhizobium sp. i1.3.1]
MEDTRRDYIAGNVEITGRDDEIARMAEKRNAIAPAVCREGSSARRKKEQLPRSRR